MLHNGELTSKEQSQKANTKKQQSGSRVLFFVFFFLHTALDFCITSLNQQLEKAHPLPIQDKSLYDIRDLYLHVCVCVGTCIGNIYVHI